MKIIYLDAHPMVLSELNIKGIQNLGEFVTYDRTSPQEIIERAKEADILLVNKVKLGQQELEQLPNLKHIAVTATGYDVIDIEAAKQLGISVSNGKNYSSVSVAQQTFALILAINNAIVENMEPGAWVNSKDFTYSNKTIFELEGKTLGLIGVGAIGEAVAKIGEAFGMEIIVNRASNVPHKKYATLSFEEVLAKADVLSLHLPLSVTTVELFNKEAFMKMKPNCIFINTARGGLINEADLADALNSGLIKGAGLDVLTQEPPLKDNPLFGAKNLIISPHVAWATKEARQRLMDIVIGNVEAFIKGKPTNLVT